MLLGFLFGLFEGLGFLNYEIGWKREKWRFWRLEYGDVSGVDIKRGLCY